jgi:hypothetical protein
MSVRDNFEDGCGCVLVLIAVMVVSYFVCHYWNWD